MILKISNIAPSASPQAGPHLEEQWPLVDNELLRLRIKYCKAHLEMFWHPFILVSRAILMKGFSICLLILASFYISSN